MRAFYALHKKYLDRLLFFTLVITFVIVFFKYLFVYVAPFFIGLMVAMVMEPVIVLLMKRARFTRGYASTVCLVLFIVAVGSLGTVIITNLSKQIGAFMEASPGLIDNISQRLDSVNIWLWTWLDQLPESVMPEFPDIRDALAAGVSALFGDGVRDSSLRIVSNVPDFFVGIILSLVSAFFFMKDRHVIGRALAGICPAWLMDNLRLMRLGLSHAVAGYFRAQFILMMIAGTLSIAGLLILRNPYALLVGLAIAVLDFLPILGSGALLLPWAAFNLITGQYQMAAGILVLYGIITVTRQVLEPKILGEQIGIHPLVTLMSVYIGYKVFGFFGILIGPSLVMICKAVLEAEQGES